MYGFISLGEFGIVYKAHLVSGRKRSRGSTQTSGAIELVAVKTLKGNTIYCIVNQILCAQKCMDAMYMTLAGLIIKKLSKLIWQFLLHITQIKYF